MGRAGFSVAFHSGGFRGLEAARLHSRLPASRWRAGISGSLRTQVPGSFGLQQIAKFFGSWCSPLYDLHPQICLLVLSSNTTWGWFPGRGDPRDNFGLNPRVDYVLWSLAFIQFCSVFRKKKETYTTHEKFKENLDYAIEGP